MTSSSFSRRVIDIGFISALVLAASAFILAGWYLNRFADGSQAVVTQVLEAAKPGKEVSATAMELLQNSLGVHTYVARVLLVSCGMFVGLAFGFLGFALFLVGATGASDVTVGGGNSLTASATALAPGTIAILAASILVGICVTRPLPVNVELGAGASDPNARARFYGADDPLSKPDPKPLKPVERASPAASGPARAP